MIDKTVVNQLVTEALQTTNCYLVDVTVSTSNEIVVEIDSDEAVDLDTCCAVSQYVNEHLDREVEDYDLEVGSCGLTSPFKILRQYQKNVGNEVECLANGKKMYGVLLQANEEGFTLQVEKKVKGEKKPLLEEIHLTYPEVKYTKYNLKFN